MEEFESAVSDKQEDQNINNNENSSEFESNDSEVDNTYDDMNAQSIARSKLANIPFEKLADIHHKVTSANDMNGPGISYHVPVKYNRDADDSRHDSKSKRSSKNAPMELSTKRAVSRFREVIEVPSTRGRDPRFDPMCGKLDTNRYESAYKFIDEYKTSEMEMLKQKISVTKDYEERKRLQTLMSRMTSQVAQKKRLNERKQLERTWKSREQDLVKNKGKKPYYLKESDKKKLEMIDKFQRVTSGKTKAEVEKVLESRRKKNATRDITRLPYARKPTKP